MYLVLNLYEGFIWFAIHGVVYGVFQKYIRAAHASFQRDIYMALLVPKCR